MRTCGRHLPAAWPKGPLACRFPTHETLEALSPLARVQEVAQMLARATADAASHEHEV